MARTEGPWGASDAPPSARAAVTDLFHHHYRRLVGLAALMVDDKESAEEVVQDAFEALYRNWDACVIRTRRSPTSTAAWSTDHGPRRDAA
jgi:DNA-directed RNA polymerase specialized sigma24 family protein